MYVLCNEGFFVISDYTCLSYRACMSSIKDSGMFARLISLKRICTVYVK